MPSPLKVLSIDGGGIRGIVAAVVLAEIERRTGKAIADLFDLIAGTSTGGILALGLTKAGPDGRPAYPAEKGIELYEREGPRIFRRPFWRRIPLLSRLLEEKYPSGGLERALREHLGEARLKEALVDVLITSYDIEESQPYFFKSSKARAEPGRDSPMWLAARATAAAPTYFEPALVPIEGTGDRRVLIDGGVFAANPAMCALAEALSGTAGEADVLLVSLGTGMVPPQRLSYEEAKGWGVAGWAVPILGVVFDGVADTVDYQLMQLLKTEPPDRRYYRFQAELPAGVDDAFDNASAANIRALRSLGEQIVRDNDALLSELCAQLVA